MKIILQLLSILIFDTDEKQLCQTTRAATRAKKIARPDLPRVRATQLGPTK